MKHSKFKGTSVLEAEIKKLKRNLASKEMEFEQAVSKLKNANPLYEDISKLRKGMKSKERQVIKAKRQLKSKSAQTDRKSAQRKTEKYGGGVQKNKENCNKQGFK